MGAGCGAGLEKDSCSLFRTLNQHTTPAMETALRVADTLKSFRVGGATAAWSTYAHFATQERRLSALRPPMEFFDYHRFSRPADFNQATTVSTRIFKSPRMASPDGPFCAQRISYNTRYFSGMRLPYHTCCERCLLTSFSNVLQGTTASSSPSS